MALPETAMDVLKKVGESIGEMPAADRRLEHERARMVLSGLRMTLDDLQDVQLASVAFVLASIMSTLNTLPVKDLAETLENSTGSYGLAAAYLVGLYDITEEPRAEAKAPAGETEYEPGGYL